MPVSADVHVRTEGSLFLQVCTCEQKADSGVTLQELVTLILGARISLGPKVHPFWPVNPSFCLFYLPGSEIVSLCICLVD